jgi:hypothetical protein
MSKKSTVIRFVEKERSRGSSESEIQGKLLDAGWHMDIIQHAMGQNEMRGSAATEKQLDPASPQPYAASPSKRAAHYALYGFYDSGQKRLAAGGAVVSALLLAAFV